MKKLSEETILKLVKKYDGNVQINPPGEDNELSVMVADWNKVPDNVLSYIENYWDIDWDDQSTTCIECGAHIHTEPGYYGDVLTFISTGYGGVCKTCVLRSSEEYIENEFLFWSDSIPVYPRAVPVWLLSEVEKSGVVPFHSIEVACKDIYESGFYAGQTDTPVDIAKLITGHLGSVEMLFCLDSVGQFDVKFSAYVRGD